MFGPTIGLPGVAMVAAILARRLRLACTVGLVLTGLGLALRLLGLDRAGGRGGGLPPGH